LASQKYVEARALITYLVALLGEYEERREKEKREEENSRRRRGGRGVLTVSYMAIACSPLSSSSYSLFSVFNFLTQRYQ
jgi:hypothetical protein